jgi:putative serine protease PepD
VTDLAVVGDEEGDEDATPVAVGESSSLRVGQGVVALGAPLGLNSTVTAGIVSATDRYVRVPSSAGSTHHLVGAIQTDAAINPGNSGGALVDCSGELVGINSAGASPPGDQGSVGLNFAIPSTLFGPLGSELIASGRVRHPTLGLQVAGISEEAARQNGVSQGLFVQQVVSGGPAQAAGVRPGDIVTSIDGRAMRSPDDLTQLELGLDVGDKVEVTYERAGQSGTVDVTSSSAE